MRVNCIAPGVVFSASAKANYDFDILGGSIPGIPAKRLGLTQEVVQLSKTFCEWEKSFSCVSSGVFCSVFLALAWSKLHQVFQSFELHQVFDFQSLDQQPWIEQLLLLG